MAIAFNVSPSHTSTTQLYWCELWLPSDSSSFNSDKYWLKISALPDRVLSHSRLAHRQNLGEISVRGKTVGGIFFRRLLYRSGRWTFCSAFTRVCCRYNVYFLSSSISFNYPSFLLAISSAATAITSQSWTHMTDVSFLLKYINSGKSSSKSERIVSLSLQR